MSDAAHRAPREPIVPPGGMELLARDMTATFSADVTLQQAQQGLAEIGQWLPIDGDSAHSLGQLVNTNSTGPLRLGYGAWRDLLLGVQFHNRRGELISAGGKTVKNVAGYDLNKFMVGQHSQFGELLTLTTRTYRRPDAAILATFPPNIDLIVRLLPSPLKPQWALLTAEALLCGYLGDEQTLAFYRTNLPSLNAALEDRPVEADIAHRTALWSPQATATFRASVPPANVPAFTACLPGTNWSADPAFGIVVGVVPTGWQESLQAAATSLGGSLIVYDHSAEPVAVNHLSISTGEKALVERLILAFGG